MGRDTEVGGPSGSFPLTRGSVLLGVRSEDAGLRARALDALVAAYWKPIYKYLRVRWRTDHERAKDSTQEFFARALEKGWIERFDPSKARFRTYLRVCLEGFVSHEREAAGRLKRGGGATVLSLDFDSAEDELRREEPAAPDDVDAYFQREWVRSVFGLVVAALRARAAAAGKEAALRVFERYDLGVGAGAGAADEKRPTYARIAEELSLPVTQVTNHLAWARAEFRRLALETLASITATEEEYREEARALLGVVAAPRPGRVGGDRAHGKPGSA
jgi:RNA polymerase sigma factor (sigma-70 family)